MKRVKGGAEGSAISSGVEAGSLRSFLPMRLCEAVNRKFLEGSR